MVWLTWRQHRAQTLVTVALLSRECERGADRLVWTQSVPRSRWLVVKFTVLGVAVALSGLAFGAEPVSCMRDRGYAQQYTLYQPADRHWRFQWTETGLLLVLTLVLAGVTARRVVTRSR